LAGEFGMPVGILHFGRVVAGIERKAAKDGLDMFKYCVAQKNLQAPGPG